MRTIKGPAIFLAQFAGDAPPFNTLDSICAWAADLGYKGVQIPSWVSSFIDLEKAATSKTYADELRGTANRHGLEITELVDAPSGATGRCASGLLTVLLMASRRLRSMAIPPLGTAWAVQQLKWAARASSNLGLNAHATFSGALAWPFIYPCPSAPLAWSTMLLMNLAAAGRQFSMSSIATASMSATKSTRARICTTG